MRDFKTQRARYSRSQGRLAQKGSQGKAQEAENERTEARLTRDSVLKRQAVAQRGKRIEYVTIAWNILEGLAAIAAGIVSGSVSLLGFGMDSIIEVASAVALLWCLSVDADVQARERNEKITLRIVGVCFFGLAAFTAIDAIADLLPRRGPEKSIAGMVLTCAALIVMPLLSRAKRHVGKELGSRAMQADAKQADFCTYLSAIALTGLLLNFALSWWWADATAALVMVPIIAREGLEAFKGETCACH